MTAVLKAVTDILDLYRLRSMDAGMKCSYIQVPADPNGTFLYLRII